MLQSRDPGFTFVFHSHISGLFLASAQTHTPAFLLTLLASRKDTVGLGSLKIAALIGWFCASLVIPSITHVYRVPTFKFSLYLWGPSVAPPSLAFSPLDFSLASR